MITLDLSGATWRTSTRSTGNGNCVEVATVAARVAVRDSKDRPGPVLVFPEAAWAAFVTGIDAVRPD
ncbi:DUF397 domain-containing protein [Micromonospora sp. KC723]|uniref:DUF397 domain-containing protein n=1 Tax=Micromonospora sp. KC723 TaxID=2530381 RepID=UPI00104C9826|nr:DUF397 domain-containing protein [Micromonospora sp. KC723]TDB71350.1 DUF397 domain-containing protein [Micromonospora sp. KC723]